ncbi:MAG: neutral zinc metallopeptidase [Acidobacteriota bacterium]
MQWSRGERSDNVEDRRGMGPGRIGGGVGIGAVLVVMVLSWITGKDLTGILGLLSGDGADTTATAPANPDGAPVSDETGQFATFVLNDTQRVWARILGPQYQPTTLVLFTGGTQSGCGFADAATGPFYCPEDHKVYIDLSFYNELDRRFGAPGDFARAYVLAHEVGHHIQSLLGIEQQMRRAQQANPDSANELSVRLELQADCFAGVWGHSPAKPGLLEPGDVEDGLAAAAAIGDDRLQKQGRGRVQPESFTHGTSAQRVEWLKRGIEQGTVEACNTFQAR